MRYQNIQELIDVKSHCSNYIERKKMRSPDQEYMKVTLKRFESICTMTEHSFKNMTTFSWKHVFSTKTGSTNVKN